MGKENHWPSCHCELMWTVCGNHHSVINQDTFLYYSASLGPHTTADLITILHTLRNTLIPAGYRNGPQLYNYLQLRWTICEEISCFLGRPRIEMCPVKMSHQRLGAQRPRRQDK